jgi:hypothetical protein
MKNNSPGIILATSTKVKGSTEAEWHNIREGSLIQFGEQTSFYTIVAAEPFFYIKAFKRKEDYSIEVKDASNNLMAGDEISLSFKEYEVLEVKDVTPDGFKSLEGLFVSPASIDEEGNVTNPGKTRLKPQPEEGKVTYVEIEDRSIEKYTVAFVNDDIVTLNRDLPKQIDEGKISCKKTILNLERSYVGKNLRGVECRVIRDFSPNLGLPLLPEYGAVNGSLMNESLKKIDLAITEIREKIARM